MVEEGTEGRVREGAPQRALPLCPMRRAKQTFHGDVDPRGQEQTPEAVVEDLVCLQRCRRVVRDFNTWKKIIIS